MEKVGAEQGSCSSGGASRRRTPVPSGPMREGSGPIAWSDHPVKPARKNPVASVTSCSAPLSHAQRVRGGPLGSPSTTPVRATSAMQSCGFRKEQPSRRKGSWGSNAWEESKKGACAGGGGGDGG